MTLPLPTARARLWLGAFALALSACAAPREPGPPPLDQLKGQPPSRALYRDGTFYLEFLASGNPVLLAAQWPTEDLRPDQHNYRVAQLDVLEDSGGAAAGALRDAQPVRLLDRSRWNTLVDTLLKEIAPATETEAALVTVQGREIVVHRAADGALKVHLHEQKPAQLRVTRAWSEADFAERANAMLEGTYASDGRVAFAVGDVDRGDSYLFFDFPQRQSVLIAPVAAPAPLAMDQHFGFTLGIADALLIRSHALAPVTRPMSTATRLAWLATQSASTLVPQTLRAPPAPPVPLAESEAMDLRQWEDRLDGMVSSKRYRGSMVPLIDGEAFFTALVQAVQEAGESILIRLYIFDRDDYALRIADLLKRRSREVDVQVLLDQVGTLAAGQQSPKAGHAHTARPDAPASVLGYLESDSKVETRVGSNPWLTSDHTKVIVIDRRKAFVGGMNIGYEYRYEWHDMMVEVEGPIVGRLHRDFRRAWAHAGPAGDLALTAMAAIPEDYQGQAERADYLDIRPLYTRTGDTEILRAQLGASRSAHRYIWVQQPYVSDDAAIAALVQARQRGVDVRVILPTHGDSGFMNSANLIAAGVFVRNGIRVYAYPGMTHVKAAIYDGWAIVGSANFDKLSLRINQETDLATSDPRFVDRLKQDLFEQDFARSRELKQPPPVGWGEYIAEFIADQL